MQAQAVLACHSLIDCLFLLEPVSCRGQRLARSNGKRNRTVELRFTKKKTYNHLSSGGWSPYTDNNVLPFGVHHTVSGAQDTSTKMYLAYRVLPKNADHFMKICNGSTHQPAHRKICLTPIMCIYMRFWSSFFFSTFYFQTHLHWFCGALILNPIK